MDYPANPKHLPSRDEPTVLRGTAADERARLLLTVWVPLAREALKLTIITAYVVFAIWFLIVHGNPCGFLPILPWALGSRIKRRLGRSDLPQGTVAGIEDEAPDRMTSG